MANLTHNETQAYSWKPQVGNIQSSRGRRFGKAPSCVGSAAPTSPRPSTGYRTTTPSKRPVKPKIKCEQPECTRKSFNRPTDLRRHIKSKHRGEDTKIWCPAPNCLRNLACGLKPYAKVRKDKLLEHIRRKHRLEAGRPYWEYLVNIAARSYGVIGKQ